MNALFWRFAICSKRLPLARCHQRIFLQPSRRCAEAPCEGETGCAVEFLYASIPHALPSCGKTCTKQNVRTQGTKRALAAAALVERTRETSGIFIAPVLHHASAIHQLYSNPAGALAYRCRAARILRDVSLGRL